MKTRTQQGGTSNHDDISNIVSVETHQLQMFSSDNSADHSKTQIISRLPIPINASKMMTITSKQSESTISLEMIDECKQKP